MKIRSRRILSAVLAVVMMVALLSVGASAATYETVKHYDNYVIIGDSIPAGYGLTTGDVDSLGNRFTLHGNELVEGSFPQLLADAIGATNVYKLARESWTSINILRLIDPEYDAELAQPKNYYDRWLSECTFFLPKIFGGIEDTENLWNTAQDAVANADVITITQGNNDTFTMAMLDPILRTMYYAFGLEIQPALTAIKGQLNTIESWDDLVQLAGGYEMLFDALETNTAKYKVRFDRMVGRILELNPDVEIYVTGAYNVFENATPSDNSIVQTLKQGGIDLCNDLKAIATEGPYADYVTYVDIYDVETWEDETMLNPKYYWDFMVHCHPDYVGHQYICDQIIAAMPEEGTNSGSGTTTDPNCPMNKYIDLVQSAWYHEPVDYVLNNGIMTGMSDNTFEPDSNVTRAQVATMLYALEGRPAVSSVAGFSDVSENDWFADPVNWAAANGVVAGMGDGSFAPNTDVTREQLATMLRSYAESKSKDVTASGDLSGFNDAASVSSWASESVAWAVGQGIISGRPGALIAPTGTATRAETATMFMQFCKKVLG